MYTICCPSCCGTFTKTTDTFDNFGKNDGTMLAIRDDTFKGAFDGIHCPSCGTELMGPGFRRRLIEIQDMQKKSNSLREILTSVSHPVIPMTLPEIKKAEKVKVSYPTPETLSGGRVKCPECGKVTKTMGFKRHYKLMHMS